MPWRRPLVVAGFLAGLLLGAATRPLATPAADRATVLPDCGGPLREVLFQWTSSAPAFAATPLEALAAALPPDCRITICCADAAAAADARRRWPQARVQVLDHPITAWPRDRFTTVATPNGRRLDATLLERGAERWPARAGDARIAADLAASDPDLSWERLSLALEGGDLVADESHLFVSGRVLHGNTPGRVADAEDLLGLLRLRYRQTPVLLPEAPDHHAGMMLMPLGDRRVVVGDPMMAQDWLASGPTLPAGFRPVCDAAMTARFDAIADRCRSAGYEVLRLPVVPQRHDRAWLTWCNGLLDGDTAYLPSFGDLAPDLEAAAYRVWRSAGYRVVPIDCRSCWQLGGTLRCLVAVLDRDRTD